MTTSLHVSLIETPNFVRSEKVMGTVVLGKEEPEAGWAAVLEPDSLLEYSLRFLSPLAPVATVQMGQELDFYVGSKWYGTVKVKP
jgi:hypothetical protein